MSIFTTNLECNPKFRDKDGLSCDSYTKNKWCTESGDQGPAWGSDYPSIDEYYNVDGETPLVCPQCGCNKGMILVLIHQVSNNYCKILLKMFCIEHLYEIGNVKRASTMSIEPWQTAWEDSVKVTCMEGNLHIFAQNC